VRRDAQTIGNLLVSAPGGERVLLGSVARIEEIEGPAEISHVNGSRLIIVEGKCAGGTSAASSTRCADSSTPRS
jgi:cobalt-zinc-cadmium resistance protein CzcA